MSVDALMKLRDDIATVLTDKAVDLRRQLTRLAGNSTPAKSRGRGKKGMKVAPKYRSSTGETWAGRGAQPVWLRELLKEGAKLEDFAISGATSRKTAKKRRKKAA